MKKKRYILSWLLTLAMIFSVLPTAAFAEETAGIVLGDAVYVDPNDPTQGFYFLNPTVTLATGSGASAITVAAPDGAEVTRNEATAAMADLPRKPRKKETESSYSNSFNDVPATHWAANHIGYMEQLGLIGGYEDGSFRPNTPVSRAEVASVVCRMPERSADLDYIKENPDKLRSFSDVAESHWAYKPVMEAANGHDYTVENDVETWTDLK